MDWTKFWPTLIPLVATLLGVFTDQIQTLLTAHPQVSLALVTVVTAIANAVTPKKP